MHEVLIKSLALTTNERVYSVLWWLRGSGIRFRCENSVVRITTSPAVSPSQVVKVYVGQAVVDVRGGGVIKKRYFRSAVAAQPTLVLLTILSWFLNILQVFSCPLSIESLNKW